MIHLIGETQYFGNLVVTPEDNRCAKVDKKTFFKNIDKELRIHGQMKKRKEATKLANLKKGVSINTVFFKVVP